MLVSLLGAQPEVPMQRLARVGVSSSGLCRALAAVLLLPCVASPAFANQAQAVAVPAATISINRSVVTLNGPWKFHTGDNVLWAEPDFDDSAWETVDLTAPPGAHDPDASLAGYVPGWGAKGHPGYSGYAWYRLRVSVHQPHPAAIALLGPGDVDNAYQVFFNDRLIGQEGEFAPVPPSIYSIVPRIITLPSSLWWGNGSDQTGVIAFRIWMSTQTAAQDPRAGGLRIAPEIGSTDAVNARYRSQWLQTFFENIVDVVLAILFLLLAVMALRLRILDRRDPFYSWLAYSLLLLTLLRANKAIFYGTQLESALQYVLLRRVLLDPLALGTWVMTWRAALGLRTGRGVPFVVGALTLAYMAQELLRRSSLRLMIGHPAIGALAEGSADVRLAMLLVLGYVVLRGARGRESLFVLPALLLVSIGLFPRELSDLHIPGIWLPFGVGVSRSQFAFAAFDVALLVLLLHRRSALANRDDQ
jgi:hypothetical protein